MGMPGPLPFFQALWAVMRLQAAPEAVGGAGRHRIDWEFDEAVLKEAAGKDFMLEAIDVLKGVLAFEEMPLSRTSSTPTGGDNHSEISAIHMRSQSSPFSPQQEARDAIQPKRARAPSDPFLDTPMLSRSVGSSLSNTTSEEPLSPVSAFVDEPTARPGPPSDESEEEYMRIWTSPDLTNPEFLNLIKVFPSHITRRALPYFSTALSKNPSDLEAGVDDAAEGRQVRCGTGILRVSALQRSDGWEGRWWTRFVLWWRRLFS